MELKNWHVNENYEDRVYDEKGTCILILTGDPDTSKEVVKATRIVAAAPDLLAACEELLDRVEKDKDARSWFKDEQYHARQAIAKARGEL